MKESAQFVAAAQEEIHQDIGSWFRGAIRLMLECVLEQEVKEMVGAHHLPDV
jgi:transposase-like protein